jgi:hypothetical protein
MGCTEIPVAATQIDNPGLLLVDSSLELARQAVKHALYLGWNRAPWIDRADPVGSAEAARATAPHAQSAAAATTPATPAVAASHALASPTQSQG